MNCSKATRNASLGLVLLGLFMTLSACSSDTPPAITLVPVITRRASEIPVVVPTVNTPMPTQPAPTGTPEPTATNTQPASPTIAPTLTVLTLTSPIKAGEMATVQIQTSAGANCFLSYDTPEGNNSEANGLGATVADSNGTCSWTWEVGGQTNPGTGKLAITANETTQLFDIIIQ